MLGRPRLSEDPFESKTVYLRPEEITHLNSIAEKEELSFTSVVRLAIRKYLNLDPIPEKKSD